MERVLEALKVGFSAWGYLVLSMALIFVVLVIIKKFGSKQR